MTLHQIFESEKKISPEVEVGDSPSAEIKVEFEFKGEPIKIGMILYIQKKKLCCSPSSVLFLLAAAILKNIYHTRPRFHAVKRLHHEFGERCIIHNKQQIFHPVFIALKKYKSLNIFR